MAWLRHQPGRSPPSGQAAGGGRLNLLLSAAGPVAWRDESWAEALPTLLEPMGVKSWRVHSGLEAAKVIEQVQVHIALVDLSLPLDMNPESVAAEEGGARLLELLGRLETPPPTVVVKCGKTHRQDNRALCDALQAGAFAVLERPVHVEAALEVMRRILARHYGDRWPGDAGPPQEESNRS